MFDQFTQDYTPFGLNVYVAAIIAAIPVAIILVMLLEEMFSETSIAPVQYSLLDRGYGQKEGPRMDSRGPGT